MTPEEGERRWELACLISAPAQKAVRSPHMRRRGGDDEGRVAEAATDEELRDSACVANSIIIDGDRAFLDAGFESVMEVCVGW